MKDIYIVLIVFASLVIMAFTDTLATENTQTANSIVKATYEPVVVLELFTSQGCSSCPSADLLLQKVKKEFANEVFALSYHIDYWNYIGWKDPFSKAAFTEKQRAYNVKFSNRTNYTPQLVVNGKAHFVGSSSAKVYGSINDYKKMNVLNNVGLSGIAVAETQVSFKYQVRGDLKNKVLRTLLVIDERTTEVKSGENRNRTLQNSNIVVAEKSFSLEQSNGVIKISVPEIVTTNDKLNLIVLVESIDYDITAAVKQALVR